MSTAAGSITRLIPQLLARDETAIGELWQRYVRQMERLARPAMKGLAPGAGDEQDVAQSAFFAFCEAAASGQAQQLESRNELWRLLSTIVRNKATDRVRRELRARRGNGDAMAPADELQFVADHRSDPAFAAEMQEAMHLLFEELDASGDPKLKPIAMLRLEGVTTPEIAAQLGCTMRTVQRKLHILERLWWERND
jgi:RNA polymerase sigma factor (sigma-70 family)